MVLFSRLRGGSAGAARGAKSFLTETVSRVRDAGATGQLTVRADSAFYSRAVLGTAVKLGVEFSVTARQDKKIRAAIEAIEEDAWTPIPYWLSTPEVSGADVAETSYTAFSGKDAMTVRLVVRRVRPTPAASWRCSPPGTTTPSSPTAPATSLEVEADHRRHAVVEQRIAELKSAGLAHLPSGKFMANAAWLALAVMAHNLARAVGRLAGPDLEKATASTLQQRVFTVPDARPQRPTPTSTTTRLLALGGGHRPSTRQHPGDPAALLTTTPPRQPGPRRSRQTGGSRTPGTDWSAQPTQIPTSQRPSTRRAVDPG